MLSNGHGFGDADCVAPLALMGAAQLNVAVA